MYQSHWGIEESPFRTQLDPRFFYESPTHEEALARLHFLVEQRRRLGLVLGSHGSGKSLLLEVFADQMRHRGSRVALVNLLGADADEVLWLVASQFGLNVGADEGVRRLWRALADRIVEHRYQQIDTVLLFDDLDRAEESTLSQIARLVHIDDSPSARLVIAVGARREHVSRLGESLLDLAELRIDLTSWELADTENYVKSALAQAGRDSPLFEDSAIERLHQLSQGVPRRINQLADLALLAGAGQRLSRIDAQTVQTVYHELGVVQI